MTAYSIEVIDGGVLAPTGFLASGVAAGLKKGGKLDIALIDAGRLVPTAAMFTTNSMAAAPVIVSRENISSGLIRAIVVNAGNANACTGESGLADARNMAAVTAEALGANHDQILVASTGVIGVPMPMDIVTSGIRMAALALSPDSALQAAQAIMTTDTTIKQAAVSVVLDGRTYRVGGMAKGSGMIMPNMATMLGFLTTDAPLTPCACRKILDAANSVTFNRISVDGETSTNDMVAIMASGAPEEEPIDADHLAYPAIKAGVTRVCRELAHMIVRDGEGATRFVTVTVLGALSETDADIVARSIANSPLVKTAIFGGDANWGRVAMAVGKAPATINPSRLEITFADITTCRDGMAVPFSEKEATTALAREEIAIIVNLHLGDASATIWTCDLSYEYVRINGEYRS